MSWRGYYLLEINTSQPQAVIDDCIATLLLSGKTLTTNLPYEKTTISKSIDSLFYVVECDCEFDTPTIADVKSDCLNGSGRTGTEVDNLLKTVTVFTNKDDCRTYIKDNLASFYSL